jgi:hypothetical protein
MTVHGVDEATSDSGCDAGDRSPGSSPCADPLAKEKLKALGLKPINAYVRVDRTVAEVSNATKKKREQRKKQSDKGHGDYNVTVNKEDKDARRTIKAVADAILADESQNVTSAVFSFISDARLFELVELLFASEADISSIIKMARRGDLATLATINTKNPKLLQTVLTLAQSEDEGLNGILRNALESSSGAKEVLNAAVAASQRPGDVLRFLEVDRRGGVRARVLRWVLRGAT